MHSEIHVLITGDPGKGKSDLLRAISLVSPRAILASDPLEICASFGKESGNVVIKGGALVLCDQGHCLIQDFEKMKGFQDLIQQNMRAPNVIVQKNGLFCSMPSNTAILAVGNPNEGHYK